MCNSTYRQCWPGQVCYDSGMETGPSCRSMPPTCPPMPGVADGRGCYCDLSNTICSIGEMCNKRNNSCSEPQVCEDPMHLKIWDGLNLTDVGDGINNFIEGDMITLTCKKYHFLYEMQVLSLKQ